MEKSFHSLPVSGSYVKSEAGAVGSVREDETNSMTDSGPVFTTGKAQEGGLPRPQGLPCRPLDVSLLCGVPTGKPLGPRKGEAASMAHGGTTGSQRGGGRGGRRGDLADCRSRMGAAAEGRLTARMVSKVSGLVDQSATPSPAIRNDGEAKVECCHQMAPRLSPEGMDLALRPLTATTGSLQAPANPGHFTDLTII